MQQFKTIIGKDIEGAKIFLRNGLIVGIPTETVYGLAGNALSEDAAVQIFTIKNRPHFDPLIVHTHSIAEIEKYVTEVPAKARPLMEHFMPIEYPAKAIAFWALPHLRPLFLLLARYWCF